MSIAPNQIESIVQKVVSRLSEQQSEDSGCQDCRNTAGNKGGSGVQESAPVAPSGEIGIFPDIDRAVEAAGVAFEQVDGLPLAKRKDLIAAMRKVVLDNVPMLAEAAWKETGLGRLEDKIKKNYLAAEKTPGVEIIEPLAFTGDDGLTLLERAPYGIIGAITPVTNPTATIINNGIGMIAAGNSVVFNPHPSAKDCSALIIKMLNEAIVEAGGPGNLLCMVAEPTIASAKQLMTHPQIRILVVTGGPAVVKAAMGTGKKVIAAGPGNPPAVVDETADIAKAGRNIIIGASFDNNIVCVLEKEVIAVGSIADQLKAEMIKNGAYELNKHQIRRLKKVILAEEEAAPLESLINKQYVGKNPSVILKEIGIKVSDEVRIVLCEVDRDHPFFWTELLMPVLPLVRVETTEEAILLAREVERGCFHTATMHSTNINNLSRMARTCNTSIFVKNGPSIAGLGVGGEGYASFSIASPTGEGLTTARTFTRERRCTLVDSFRII